MQSDEEGKRCKAAMIIYFGDKPPAIELVEAFAAGWLAKKINAANNEHVRKPS
jgi:hypothetical protein